MDFLQGISTLYGTIPKAAGWDPSQQVLQKLEDYLVREIIDDDIQSNLFL